MEKTIAGPKAKPGIERIARHMLDDGAGGFPPAWAFLNSNESAYGPSQNARAAARASSSCIERYLEDPDALLAPQLAAHHGLDHDLITIGQGSDDLLARLFRAYLRAGDELVRSANGYMKAPNYAYANGGNVVSVEDNDLKPSVDRMIDAVTDRTRIVYLANPENPAGTYLSKAGVERLHSALPDNVLLVLDCAYAEYAWADDYDPCHGLVELSSNVIVCHTFSKIYGLAGARVGWAYGPVDVIDTARRVGLTFPVATQSIAAARAALDDQTHVAFVRRENRAALEWFCSHLTRLGLQFVPSQTNFVLVKMTNEARCKAAVQRLADEGILVRRMKAPAYGRYFRVTMGHRQELEATVRVLETVQ